MVSRDLEGDSLELVEPRQVHANFLLPAFAHLTRGEMRFDGVRIQEGGFLCYGFQGADGGLDCAGSVALFSHPEGVG